MKARFFPFTVLLLLSCSWAQHPRFTNAQITTEPAHDLAAQLHQAEQSASAVWFGYAVQGMPGQQWECGTIYLNRSDHENVTSAPLRQPEVRFLLLRLDAHAVSQVRLLGSQCQIDAGGASVTWLTDASAAQSAALLGRLAAAQTRGALAALAQSAGPAADVQLDQLTTPGHPEKLREKVVFWLGSARGHAGFLTLQRLARDGNNVPLDRRIAFAFSVSSDPAAVDELIRQAKLAPSPHVREQALFWLGQKASKRALGTIADVVANDPDTRVKERAVFALSQLPDGAGAPRLIAVAQSNANPAVRKRAMFWLAQSHDARALAFFKTVLTH